MSDSEIKTEKKSIPALLLGIIIQPKNTLTYLKDNRLRTWWIPALLALIFALAPVLVPTRTTDIAPITGDMTDMPMDMGGVYSETPMLPPVSAGPNILAILGAALGTPLAWVIWGGALYLASVFLGRSSGFFAMFRLTLWTWIPYTVRGLIQTIYILATGNPIVNAGLSGLVLDKSNANALIIPPGPGQLALASILSRIDLYTIWNLFLLGVGLAVFTNLPRRKALTTILIIWGVFALLGVIPGIIGGMFGSIGGGGGGPVGSIGGVWF